MKRKESGFLTESDRDTLAQCAIAPAPLQAFLSQQNSRIQQAFDAGAPVAPLLTARAEVIDAILRHLWKIFELDQRQTLALAAVGGYGRSELHPQSDIDLLILQDDENGEVTQPAAKLEAFIALLWDLHLTVGHSVRSVDQCAQAAQTDVTIMTNLLDARLLCGEPMLLVQLQKRLSPILMWPPDAFFRGKRDEQIARHRKFEGTAYKLEPNLKSSPGGLRDIQNIYWIAKRRFGDSSLQAFTRRGLFSLSEYRALSRCLNFLWKVRFALHTVAGRAEDRLLFDLQIQVAERLGYIDLPGKRAVEQFMKQYFRAVLTVRNLNEMLLELFDEVMLGQHGEISAQSIDEQFEQVQGRVRLRENQGFAQNPEGLLLLFVRIAEDANLTGICAVTLRALRECRPLIDTEYRRNPRHQQLFIRLLRARDNLSLAFFLMKDTGILGAYIPAFATITGQMQFDRFHHYTVDEHTLFLLRNLVRLSEPQHSGLFAVAERIMQKQVAPEIIYLAGLFHDIGKGRGGDHAQLGAVDALEFCQSIGMSDVDAGHVSWLVEQHLSMSLTAQRKDISDPDVISEFAQRAGNIERLEWLYVLTICDIRATNASLWNGWKDALLRDLYLASSEYLRSGAAETAQDRELHTREAALAQLLRNGSVAEEVHDLWRRLGADYFAKVSSEQLVWVTQVLLQHGANDEPLVALRNNASSGGTEVLVFVTDRDYLFATITSLLAQKKVNIQAATIHTTPYGRGLDSFLVLEENGEPVQDAPRLHSIQRYLQQHLHSTSATPLTMQKAALKRQPFQLKTQISFLNDSRKQRTALELITLDRPGLLARVGAAFKYCDVQLHNAKIITLGERAEDVFFITDKTLQPLTVEHQEQLHKMLLNLLDAGN